MKLSLETLSQSLAQDFWRVLSTLKAQTFESKGVWRLSMNVNVEKRPTFFRFTYFSGRNPGKWVCCQQKITWVLQCHTVRSTVQALAGWQVEVERRNFQTLSETWSSNGFEKEWNQLVHFWIWCDAVVLTACARAFPQQEYTFQECACGFLTCMCYTVLQKSQKSSRYDALPQCPCKSAQGMCLKSSKHTLWRDRSKQKLLRTDKQQACSKDDVGWRNSFPVNRVCLRSLCQKSIESNQLMVSTQVLQMIMSESSNQVVVEKMSFSAASRFGKGT